MKKDKFVIISTFDFFSLLALQKVNQKSKNLLFIKVNIPLSFKIKMFYKGLLKSPIYLMYLLYENFMVGKLKKLKSLVNANIKFIYETKNMNNDKNLRHIIEKLSNKYNVKILFIRPFFIIKKDFLDKYECYNLHNTLLPKYRGLGGIFYTLRDDEKIIGLTIHKMIYKLDAGDILIQKIVPVNTNSLFDLTVEVYESSADIINEFLNNFDNYSLKPQDEKKATSHSWPKLKDILKFKRNKKKFLTNKY